MFALFLCYFVLRPFIEYNYIIPNERESVTPIRMKLKTNLHLHTHDDPEDSIDYSFIDVVDAAQKYGFECLALTCHNTFVNREEYKKAAEARGILFVSGIERTIEHCHVLILNPDHSVEAVDTFAKLEIYKNEHPEILIIAPHPYFSGGYSLGKKLEEYAYLFDAVEHSWFYSAHVNFNKKAERVAKKICAPFIATSDMHDIRFLNTNYAEIEVEEKTIPALFHAIRNNNFSNTTSPRKLLREMVPYVLGRALFHRKHYPPRTH